MEKKEFNDCKNLSECESMIMKTIWDHGEDMSLSDLMEALRTRYEKDYARTTVSTFLLKLYDKGFARTYRKGRNTYICPIKTEEEYRQKLLQEEMDFWYQGRASNLVAALGNGNKISREDIKEIRRILDELDD